MLMSFTDGFNQLAPTKSYDSPNRTTLNEVSQLYVTR